MNTKTHRSVETNKLSHSKKIPGQKRMCFTQGVHTYVVSGTASNDAPHNNTGIRSKESTTARLPVLLTGVASVERAGICGGTSAARSALHAVCANGCTQLQHVEEHRLVGGHAPIT